MRFLIAGLVGLGRRDEAHRVAGLLLELEPDFRVEKFMSGCLELRSLPSTGVTRLPRYYEPLRHPRAPSLSLAGFRLVIADHALGTSARRASARRTSMRQISIASESYQPLSFFNRAHAARCPATARPARAA
jgi:hypothetical protein